MLKKEVIQEIRKEVAFITCEVVKIYGVSCGVGYNLAVHVTYKSGVVDFLKAKAMRQSWACVGWLRENERGFDLYKGSNAPHRYIEGVKNYWEDGKGLEEYLNRFKKQGLIEFLEDARA